MSSGSRLPASVSWSLALVMALVFAWISWVVFLGNLQDFDNGVALTMKENSGQTPFWRPFMIGLTLAGGIPAMFLLDTAGAIWQWRRGRRLVALAWVLICGGGALLDLGLKKSFDRERPPALWRDPFVQEKNESYPSGHAMGSTIGFGMLAFTLLLDERRRRTKVMIVAGLGILVLLIGCSRIYLRAHWFSDVLAGFAVGLAWLGLGLGFLWWVGGRAGSVTPGRR